jgi:hypothetical protein
MTDLSLIIVACNEWPHLYWTIQSIRDNIRDALDYEIIVVDNLSMQMTDERGQLTNAVEKVRGIDRVKLLHYPLSHPIGNMEFWETLDEFKRWATNYHHWTDGDDLRLSHWQAKNFALQHAQGRVVQFCDAHNLFGNTLDGEPTIPAMYRYYMEHCLGVGALSLPQRYMNGGKPQAYAMRYNHSRGLLHYRFCDAPKLDAPHPIPCMTSCHMMLDKTIIVDRLGGWPIELGIWGGGENFLNFALAVTGHDHTLFARGVVHHFAADHRGYSWNWLDFHRNRMVALYIVAGEEWLRNYVEDTIISEKVAPCNQPEVRETMNNVLQTCKAHHDLIRERSVMSIEQWVRRWLEQTDPCYIDWKVSERDKGA